MEIKNSDQEINSKMINVLDIFDKLSYANETYRLNIPGFQRGFAWNNENIESLFNDFEENNNNYREIIASLTGYLLGNVVLIRSKNGDYDVVDGQQRITVFSLIVKALSDRYKQFSLAEFHSKSDLSDLEKMENINNYLNESKRLASKNWTNTNEPRLKHNHELSYAKTYLSIINDKESIETDTASDNLKSVWQGIQSYINKLDLNNLEYINHYLSSKVKIIVTTTPNENNAYQLFEALNNRGQELLPLDLIKNNLMKTISSENEVTITDFNNAWIPFIENISSINNSASNPTTFLRYFVMKEYGIDKTNNSLFNFFKDLDLNSREIIDLVNDLKQNSKIYSEIVNNPKSNPLTKGTSHSPLFHPDYLLFTLLSTKGMKYRQIHPLLMMFYESDEKTRDDIIYTAIKTAISMNFTKSPSENTKQIVKFIKIYHDTLINDDTDNVDVRLSKIKANADTKIKARNALIKAMQNYNRANQKLLKTSLSETSYSLPTSRVLIKIIEFVINENYSDDITLEHILPQKFQDLKLGSQVGHLGFNPKDEKNKSDADKEMDDNKISEQYVNKLGNFTALKRIENKDTEPINIKIRDYIASNFYMTQAICGDWEISSKDNKKHVQKRLKYEKSYDAYKSSYDKEVNNKPFIKYFIDNRTSDLATLISKFTNGELE